MFSPNPAPSTAGSGYNRARTPQGGKMSPTALGALFSPVTTTEGLTAAEAEKPYQNSTDDPETRAPSRTPPASTVHDAPARLSPRCLVYSM